MNMTYRVMAQGLVVTCLIGGCGSSSDTPDAGSSRWGTETPQGPRVRGASGGTRTVIGPNGQSQTGTLYDSDGNGQPDEIDLDGDGISDGEDVNGDGEITVWRNLPVGDDRWSADMQNLEIASTPAAVENRLASVAPLPGETPTGPRVGATGGVNLVSGAVPTGTPQPGVLAARSQGSTNSCGAFATSAAVALVRYATTRASNPMVDVNSLWPAPLYVYQYNARPEAAAGGGMECSGTVITQNLDRFLMFGAPSESELSFGSITPQSTMNLAFCTAPTADPAATAATREANRIAGHVSIRGTGEAWRTEVKRQLDMGRPVVFGVTLPLGFDEFRATRLGSNGMPTDVTQVFRGNGMCTTSGHCGGHAMVFTGYDDARRAYRVLNSWGGDWGDNGYLWWDYASLEALGPHASAVIPLPPGAAPLGVSSPDGVSVTVGPMTTPAYARDAANGYWTLIARVQWSEPVTITGIATTVGGNTINNMLSNAMLLGDVPGIVFGSNEAGFDPMSVVGQMATMQITATTRSGATITRALPMFNVPAPTM